MRIKLGFGNQCLLALVLGLVFGHFLPSNIVGYISPFGDIFLKLLKLVIVPLTFSTIVASFSKLESIALVKKLGLNTLVWFVITALLASSVGVIVGAIFNPGSNLQLDPQLVSHYTPREIPTIANTLLNMVPGNLIKDIADGKVIPVIIFAIFFGIALTSLHEKGKNLRNFFDEFSHTMFKITRVIIRMSPIGIFALVVPIGNEYGIATLLPLVKFIIAIYLACVAQLCIYAVLLIVVAKKKSLSLL